MAIDAPFDRRRWRNATSGVGIVLVVANLMSNRVLPAWAYMPWNVAVAAAIVALALSATSREQLGFTAWRRGAAWGLVLLVLTIAVLALAITMPAFNELYHDRRVSAGTGTWLYQAFVRIPFGTVLLEEVAFRGVLPGLFMLRWGVLRGCLAASVCFGLWHVLPALTLNEVNPVATRLFGTGAGGVAIAVVFAVLSTAIVGMWFCWIRLRSGSVLAPMLAHLASNSGAYTIAWLVTR
ncbi:MAG: CPBP family intramembrane glutamic endopeptidase [Ilumatobacteraceae bacterium]